MKLSFKERLENLKKQETQLKARIQLMENKNNEEKRKRENRVKFLLGAFLLRPFNHEVQQ